MTNIKIVEATNISEYMHATICKLIRQLSESATPPSINELSEVIKSPSTTLLLAYKNDSIAGMLTIFYVHLSTGYIAHIEDTVVDESVRGQGIGRFLVLTALHLAHERGIREVQLTSRPARVAANELYRSLGFIQYETNVYKLRASQNLLET